MAGGKKPDWNLSAMDPENICKGKVGAGWSNDDGTISMKLDPFVTLSAMDNLKIKLFPYEELSREQFEAKRKQRERDSATTPSGAKAGHFDDLEDDIPF